MHRVAVISDIHSNVPALESVLVDISERGLGLCYCLGDLVGYGTFPNEVIQTIRQQDIPTVMGNYDQGVGNSSDECGCAYRDPVAEALGKRSIAWSNAHTSQANKGFLRELPSQIPLQLGGLHVNLVHGSPRRINEYLFEDRPDKSLERLLDLVESDVMVCGHTHLPYHRVLPSGRHVVNAGSVGKPKDGDPRACYAVLEADGGQLGVEFVRVPYDIERVTRAIESSAMPDEYAEMLRAGTR
jgi:putative phosphoesterase